MMLIKDIFNVGPLRRHSYAVLHNALSSTAKTMHGKAKAWRPVDFGLAGTLLYIAMYSARNRLRRFRL